MVGTVKLFLHLELNDRDEGFVIEWDYISIGVLYRKTVKGSTQSLPD